MHLNVIKISICNILLIYYIIYIKHRYYLYIENVWSMDFKKLPAFMK